MKPSELLREVKRRLLAGPASKTWVKGRFCDYDIPGETRCCVSGRVGRADRALDASTRDEAVMTLRDDPAVRRRANDEAAFNDHPRTSLWDVVALVGRAIRRLEAEGK